LVKIKNIKYYNSNKGLVILFKIQNILMAMVFMRILSGLIELSAALLMHYFNNVSTAIRINAILGLIGPIILIIVTSLGLIEIREQINYFNLLLIFIGVSLILIATI